MTIKIGINGFGRIGRNIFRSAQKRKDMQIIAINDILETHYIAYMLKYDSVHGKFLGKINYLNNNLIVEGKKIICTSIQNPKYLKWNEIGVDIVIESTGKFLSQRESNKHILSGAKKVIITAPTKDNTPMFVMGVNHCEYKNQNIISNASCTTNCLAPLIKIIDENFYITGISVTTVHAITATQNTVDSASIKDWRSGRCASRNIIPSSTSAIQAIEKIIPKLKGKINGLSFRVPTANVSVADMTIRTKYSSSSEEINNIIKEASEKKYRNIIGYTEEDVVSSDINGEIFSCIFDKKASMLIDDKLIKLVAWYDNETGFSNRILDLISHIS